SHIRGSRIRPARSHALFERLSRLCGFSIRLRQSRLERSGGTVGAIARPLRLGELSAPCLQLLSFTREVRLQPPTPIKDVQVVDDLADRRTRSLPTAGAIPMLRERHAKPLFKLSAGRLPFDAGRLHIAATIRDDHSGALRFNAKPVAFESAVQLVPGL